MRERTVELAFENKRMWDLMRRREFHQEFNNRSKHALLPVLDLREDPVKYIFIRMPAAKHQSTDFPEQGLLQTGTRHWFKRTGSESTVLI